MSVGYPQSWCLSEDQEKKNVTVKAWLGEEGLKGKERGDTGRLTRRMALAAVGKTVSDDWQKWMSDCMKHRSESEENHTRIEEACCVSGNMKQK